MRLTRNILASLLAFLLILLLFLPVWFISGICRREAFIYSSARLVIGAAVRVLGVRTVVRGLDAVDLSRPPVIISNHLSNLDGPLLVLALPLNPRVLIKSEARRIPLVGWVMKLAGFVFVDRSSAPRRQEALAAAVERITRARCPFLVFPEGTRSRDGVTRPFKRGGFLIARRAGVPVLPVRISGTQRLLPPGRATCAAGTVFIDVFPLVDPGQVAESELPGLIRGLQQKLYTEEKA
ncbi:MAG: 1-acyl-sn-glycerol-3-phosphate acyltransferase [Acidobacteria bacterium]|jgi:1-acyl-sn-glycerol-3-phosphate acyltransferase|nr:1-acyl-sn-glycerol-3-phosphate acyltransferase [Acidobacteriota bacterium]